MATPKEINEAWDDPIEIDMSSYKPWTKQPKIGEFSGDTSEFEASGQKMWQAKSSDLGTESSIDEGSRVPLANSAVLPDPILGIPSDTILDPDKDSTKDQLT